MRPWITAHLGHSCKAAGSTADLFINARCPKVSSLGEACLLNHLLSFNRQSYSTINRQGYCTIAALDQMISDSSCRACSYLMLSWTCVCVCSLRSAVLAGTDVADEPPDSLFSTSLMWLNNKDLICFFFLCSGFVRLTTTDQQMMTNHVNRWITTKINNYLFSFHPEQQNRHRGNI